MITELRRICYRYDEEKRSFTETKVYNDGTQITEILDCTPAQRVRKILRDKGIKFQL